MHVRDFVGFEEMSRKILISKPSILANWVSLAGACYMNRNYSGCLQAIDSIMKFNLDDSGKARMKRFESNEVILMGVRALLAQNKYQEALTFMSKNKKYLVDSVAKQDTYGFIHKQLGNEAESISAYENLLQLNAANLDTYKKILGAKGIALPKKGEAPLTEAY